MTEIKFLDEKYDWKNLTLWDFLQQGNYPTFWNDFFTREDVQQEIQLISQAIDKEAKTGVTIYPPINQVFRAFYSVPVDKIRLVMLGMDPYHNGSAVGLCFSVLSGNAINPSLRNIYKELKNNGFNPKENGDLTHLPKQGVFLLNTALTVEKGCPDSHTHLWYNFSEKVIKYVASQVPTALWLLMGSKALEFVEYLNKEHVMGTSHPMPLSAYRELRGYPAFIGSGVFQKINKKIDIPISW